MSEFFSSIDLHHPHARRAVAEYIGSTEPLPELGHGVGGAVFARPSTLHAIKVHLQRDNFSRELAAYRRLAHSRVDGIEGFAIPKLINADERLRIIEMTIVSPPWLLDFGNALLQEPDFEQSVMDDWWTRIEDRFGEKFPVVQSVYYALLARCGIHYLDFKPGNIEF